MKYQWNIYGKDPNFKCVSIVLRWNKSVRDAIRVLLFLYHIFMKTNCFLSKWVRAYYFVLVRTFKNFDFWKSKFFKKQFFISISLNEYFKSKIRIDLNAHQIGLNGLSFPCSHGTFYPWSGPVPCIHSVDENLSSFLMISHACYLGSWPWPVCQVLHVSRVTCLNFIL